MVIETGRDLLKFGEREKVLVGTRRLATPFLGFVLSDFYLSEEIVNHGLQWLNEKSRQVVASEVKPGQVIYCQVDQIDEFASTYLPFIEHPFVLITGKWHLPGLARTLALETILSADRLVAWFSQNQIYSDIPIRNFPYGVPLERAYMISLQMESLLSPLRRKRLYVPAVTAHKHLEGRARELRIALQELMGEYVEARDYYREISDHFYIISPPGDRPDTYRHWEAIALGSVPISEVPLNFKNLFGKSMLITQDLLSIFNDGIPANACQSNPVIATSEYWRIQISLSRQTFFSTC